MASFTSLTQMLQRWSRDTGTDFLTSTTDMITQGELQISKELNVDAMRVRSALALLAGTFVYNKPSGCISIRHISYVDGNGEIVFMEYRRREVIMDYAPKPNLLAARAEPLFWDNYDTDTLSRIYVGPTPIAGRTGEMEYEQRIVGLSATTQNTWISDNQEDLLFYSCILKGADWAKSPQSQTVWKDRYNDRLAVTVAEVNKIRSDATSILRAQ